MSRVTLFVSAGRCGTQWLARHLGDVCRNNAVVRHEPLRAQYRPRCFFRDYDGIARQLEVSDIARHVDWVRHQTRTRRYAETGWPCFAAIPLFLDVFPDVQIVHLTRHPVPSALSHMVHQTYGGSPRDDEYTQLAVLDPTCARVFQVGYEERWHSMTPYEKTLYWWTEIHAYAEELRTRYADVPFLRLRSEELFEPDSGAANELVAFLDLDGEGELASRRRRQEDRWHHRTDLDFEPGLIHEHPLALVIAERLGYDVDDYDRNQLTRRYKRGSHDSVSCVGGKGPLS